MKYNFHLIFEKGDKYYIGYCPEVPGANGQGKTEDECRQSVLEAVELILQCRLEETLKDISADAKVEKLPIC